MTDKQIIIDVSKCKECGLRNCDGKLIYWCHTYDDHCADFNDCYYKQLKRKEQECEGLKEAQKNSRCAWKSFEGTFCPEAQEQLEAYKMEADEGKEINAELKAENENWQKEYWKLEQGNDFLAETNSRLKQTLTEIKEIAEKSCCLQATSTCEEYENCNECNRTSDDVTVKHILQKISEVEDE